MQPSVFHALPTVLRRWCGALSCVLGLTALSHANELVIVGTAEPPMKMQQDDRFTGIDIDIVSEAFQRLGVDHRFILVESGTRMLHMLSQGQADMGLVLSHSPDREALAYYPEESYLNLDWNFFIHRDNIGRIYFHSFEDLQGLRIGATQGYAYTEAFWNAGLELDIVTQNDLQLAKLRAGRIDAVALNTIATRYELGLLGWRDEITYVNPPLRSATYYNVFSKASTYPNLPQLVVDYSQTIAAMKADGTIDRIKMRYLE